MLQQLLRGQPRIDPEYIKISAMKARQIFVVVVAVLVAAVLLPSHKPILAGLAAIAMGCASCGRLPLVPAVVNVLDSPFPIATTAVPVLHCRMHCRAQIKQGSQRQGQCP
jgi:hypothetical protein